MGQPILKDVATEKPAPVFLSVEQVAAVEGSLEGPAPMQLQPIPLPGVHSTRDCSMQPRRGQEEGQGIE